MIFRKVPSRIFVALVKGTAHSGTSNENPFKLHHDISSIDITLRRLEMNFTNGNFAMAYFHSLLALGFFGGSETNDLSIDNFEKRIYIYRI